MSEDKNKVVLHAEIEGIDITITALPNFADFASDMMLNIIDKIEAWDIKKLEEAIKKEEEKK